MDIASVRLVSFINRIDDAITLGICHELSTVADQTAGRDLELQTGVTAADTSHVLQFAFSLAKFIDNSTCKFIRNVDVCALHRFCFFAVFIGMIQNFCFADCEFIAFTTHVLDENGQM